MQTVRVRWSKGPGGTRARTATKSTRNQEYWELPRSEITCDTVRAYVSQMGIVAAKAMARANGMTAAQERRARQCLASRD